MRNYSEIVEKKIKCALAKPRVPEGTNKLPYEKFSKNSTIAFIGPDELADDLSYEVNVVTPAAKNTDFSSLEGVDFLLVSSGWFCTEDWNYYSVNQHKINQLRKIIDFLKKRNIQSTFWMIDSSEYSSFYKNIISLFDRIYSVNNHDKFTGVEVSYLPSCVQPAKYYPMKNINLQNLEPEKFDILLDGWSDLDKFYTKFEDHKWMLGDNCCIVDSTHIIFKGRIKQMAGGAFGNVRGSIRNEEDFRYYATSSNVALGLNPSHRTEKTIEKLALIYAACGKKLHILDDKRKLKNTELVESITSEKLENLIENKDTDSFEIQKKNFLAWRHVMSKHTLKHRLKIIYHDILAQEPWEEFPKVSIIVPTNRAGYANNVYNNFLRQKYPNIELIIVATASVSEKYEGHKVYKNNKSNNIKIIKIPDNWYAGRALNTGVVRSEGKYIFRFDDDDEYGAHYVSDTLLYSHHINFDICGKPTQCRNIRIDNSKEITQLKRGDKIRYIYPERKPPIQGNSFCVKRSLMDKYRFNDNRYGDIDTDFLNKAAKSPDTTSIISDNFNIIIARRSDKSTHTWSSEKFDKNLQKDSLSLEDESFVMI